MPPGHLNAIFLKDVNPLDVNDWKDAVKAAVEQCFCFLESSRLDRTAGGRQEPVVS